VPQWGEHDAVWGKLAADRAEKRWTVESVALTNNGSPNPDCAPGGHPADWRPVPPGMFYCSVVCDGKTRWEYDRSRQEATAWAYEREGQLGMCYNRVVSHLTNFSELQVGDVRDGKAKATYEGTYTEGPWPLCHQVLIVRPGEQLSARRWLICPDLGYAVVRSTSCSVMRLRERPVEYLGMEHTFADFTEAAPGVWCAQESTLDFLDMTREPAGAQWDRSIVTRLRQVTLGEPVDTSPPSPYPFDTRVEDLSTSGPRPPEEVLPLRPEPKGPVDEPNPDRVVELMEETIGQCD